jgi:tight adherence protein C
MITSIFIGGLATLGFLQIGRSFKQPHIPLTESISPYIGLQVVSKDNQSHVVDILREFLTSGSTSPWASDKRVLLELRKSDSSQTLISFRIEQIIFAAFSSVIFCIWVVLRLVVGNSLNPVVALISILVAFIGGGGFRSWLLKEKSRRRQKLIEEELPAILDLLAFAVSAGEPVATAMQRVAQTCSGNLSLEIRRLISGLDVGDNFILSLDRTQRELNSPSVSRAFRALMMAIERGTPIADVLRAQAMDARNLEARKLMTLAGKKETLMMIPVVFLILPLIVVVALYPGLIALNNF